VTLADGQTVQVWQIDCIGLSIQCDGRVVDGSLYKLVVGALGLSVNDNNRSVPKYDILFAIKSARPLPSSQKDYDKLMKYLSLYEVLCQKT
jgi:hypothetical protein